MNFKMFALCAVLAAAGAAPAVPALAQTHDQICLDNETQCLKGCDGAVQCSNQCRVNYQKCLDQGH